MRLEDIAKLLAILDPNFEKRMQDIKEARVRNAKYVEAFSTQVLEPMVIESEGPAQVVSGLIDMFSTAFALVEDLKNTKDKKKEDEILALSLLAIKSRVQEYRAGREERIRDVEAMENAEDHGITPQ